MEEMRTYASYFSVMQEGELINNLNTSCWAGLAREIRLREKNEFDIYIYKFTCNKTYKYIPLIIEVINKITPCELVIINEIEYIKLKVFPNYDKSLIILNFIRNLWNSFVDIYSKNDGTYNVMFFEILKESKQKRLYRDPMKLLTYANKKACENLKTVNSAGHSNIHLYSSLKIKTLKEYLNFNSASTKQFLTS